MRKTVGVMLLSGTAMIKLLWETYPKGLLLMLGVSIVDGSVPVALSWLMKRALDIAADMSQISATLTPTPGLVLLIIAYASTSLFSKLFQAAASLGRRELDRKLIYETRIKISDKVTDIQGLAHFESPEFHDLIQQASQQAQFRPTQMVDAMVTAARSAITLSGFLFLLFSFNPWFAGALIILTTPALYINLIIGSERYKLANTQVSDSRRAGYYTAVLTWADYAKELRLNLSSAFFKKRFSDAYRKGAWRERQQDLREARWHIPGEILASLITIGSFVYIMLEVTHGHGTLGDIPLYTRAAASVHAGMLGLIIGVSNAHESSIFFSSLERLLSLPQPIYLHRNPQPFPNPILRGIEFRRVEFKYPGSNNLVICGLDLFIPAGRKLALVGPNGSGKSTIIKLLTRLYDPSSGEILIDDIDIREFDVSCLRKMLAVVFQDYRKYDLTAYENIGQGNLKEIANYRMVREAAQKAGIHHKLLSLPDGYHTLLSKRFIGENGDTGTELSVGEWQKVALARSLMKDAQIFILDEPTASLDAKSEHGLYKALAQNVLGRTCLLVSHRLTTILADNIAYLKDGRVVEYGPHADLLARKGEYASVFNLQKDLLRT